MDDRMVKHLEEQLANAHTTNSELRNRLLEAEARIAQANTNRVKGRDAEAQLEGAYTKKKAAEDNAAAAQRKCEEAELEAVRTRGELEELQARFEIVSAEADRLHVLEDRIAKAQHAGDLFAA